MAKGSPFWGKQKGKLGETVLAVVKGQQIQRAYNAEPANPRSNKQTAQRIVFASAVKFFKSAIASQFKFAYEDKKQTESDYNAFMRHNVRNGMIIDRAQYLQTNFPSVGEFILAKGSLAEIPSTSAQGSKPLTFPFGVEASTAPTTLQQVANNYKNGFDLHEGDIITIVAIISHASSISDENIPKIDWNVVQIKVGDSADTRTVESVASKLDMSATNAGLTFTTTYAEARGYSIIVSRPTTNGLLVSTARVWYNDTAKAILNTSHNAAYIKYAKDSWGMGKASLLEGSQLPNV